MINNMFEKIPRITLDILLNIANQIKLHSHEFESFDTDEYRRSDLREVLKEEYLRVVFYEKVKNSIISNLTISNRDLIPTKCIALIFKYLKNLKIKN